MILHIGLGKTGTTSLQSHIFPRLLSMGVLEQYNPAAFMALLMPYETLGVGEDALKSHVAGFSDRTLISLESLIGWNPGIWDLNFARVKAVFPPDTRVVVTLRDPESYLTSVYVQMIQQGMMVRPEDFFLPEKQYQLLGPICRVNLCEKFSVDDLDYMRLVAMYAEYFSQIWVVSYASINDLYFLRDLLSFSEADRLDLVRYLAGKRRENVSYSTTAIKLCFLRERFFRLLGARTHSSQDSAVNSALRLAERMASSEGMEEGSVTQARKRIKKISWRYLMQNCVGKFLPHARYRLPLQIPRGRFFQKNHDYYHRVSRQEMGYLRCGLALDQEDSTRELNKELCSMSSL